jgi:hypothetical protein
MGRINIILYFLKEFNLFRLEFLSYLYLILLFKYTRLYKNNEISKNLSFSFVCQELGQHYTILQGLIITETRINLYVEYFLVADLQKIGICKKEQKFGRKY